MLLADIVKLKNTIEAAKELVRERYFDDLPLAISTTNKIMRDKSILFRNTFMR